MYEDVPHPIRDASKRKYTRLAHPPLSFLPTRNYKEHTNQVQDIAIEKQSKTSRMKQNRNHKLQPISNSIAKRSVFVVLVVVVDRTEEYRLLSGTHAWLARFRDRPTAWSRSRVSPSHLRRLGSPPPWWIRGLLRIVSVLSTLL